MNKVGMAVCGLHFDNSERILADLGATFRDLLIGTLAPGPLHYVHYLTALQNEQRRSI